MPAREHKEMRLEHVAPHLGLADGAEQGHLVAQSKPSHASLELAPEPGPPVVVLPGDRQSHVAASIEQQADGRHEVLMPLNLVEATAAEDFQRLAGLHRPVGRRPREDVRVDPHWLDDGLGQRAAEFGRHLREEPAGDDGAKPARRHFSLCPGP